MEATGRREKNLKKGKSSPGLDSRLIKKEHLSVFCFFALISASSSCPVSHPYWL